MKTLCTILGTRPEVVKMSPLLPRLDRGWRHVLVHTGQHHDPELEQVFFEELGLRAPDHQLSVPGGGAAVQVGAMLASIEPVLATVRPDAVVVQGDTNSGFAGAWVAARLGIPVLHVEAGCRSFVPTMPEEMNRVLIARMAALHFAPDAVAVRNLRREGIPGTVIHEVGNTGLDACRRIARLAKRSRLAGFGVKPGRYAVATFHRAENTDDSGRLRGIVGGLERVARELPVLVPLHPRTAAALRREGMDLERSGLRVLPPLGPLDFTALLRDASLVLSDSGGVQEEAAVLNRPCLILRDETEWKRLVTAGKNFIAGTEADGIVRLARRFLGSRAFRDRVRAREAPLRFGATDRIVEVLKAWRGVAGRT